MFHRNSAAGVSPLWIQLEIQRGINVYIRNTREMERKRDKMENDREGSERNRKL